MYRTARLLELRLTYYAIVAVAIVPLHLGSAAAQSCLGDCNGDTITKLGEVQEGFVLFLDGSSVGTCPNVDSDADGSIRLSEVQLAFNNFLDNCELIIFRGMCLRPAREGEKAGPDGLVTCDDGTMVQIGICEDSATCLEGTEGIHVIEIGQINSKGRFSALLARSEVGDAAIVFSALVDEDRSTMYRVIGFGRITATDDGSGTGIGEPPPDVMITPSSEAGVQILNENGFSAFDQAGVLDVLAAVDAANAGSSFAGLTAEEASNGAAETARKDPVVIQTIECNLGVGVACPARHLPVGERPSAVDIGDINHDGTIDIITANEGSDDLSLLFGLEGGRFAAETRLSSGRGPVGVQIVDFDGNEIPDLVAVNMFSEDVAVFQGTETGQFIGPRRYAVGMSPVALATGDFNSDSFVDIATANSFGTESVSILFGRGDGTFGGLQSISTGSSPSAIRSVDLDGDGSADLVVVSGLANAVSLLFGNGDGSFADVQNIRMGIEPIDVGVSDLDSDGDLDLVTANPGDDQITVRLSLGGREFGPEAFFPAGLGPIVLDIADFDGDKKPDVIAAASLTGFVSVLVGRGDGTFVAGQVLDLGAFPDAIVAADVDDNGVIDIVTANLPSDDVSVLLRR